MFDNSLPEKTGIYQYGLITTRDYFQMKFEAYVSVMFAGIMAQHGPALQLQELWMSAEKNV